MANLEHVAILKEGVRNWNLWRQQYADVTPDLSFADLSGLNLGAQTSNAPPINFMGVNLRSANLEKSRLEYAWIEDADLSGANLKYADLDVARMSRANLSNADLRHTSLLSEFDDLSGITELGGANLSNANFSFARLRDVDLSFANLTGTTFYGTSLRMSAFSNTTLCETVFANVDLTNAHGFETCKHLGPSYIDASSMRSAGELPINFLRGCGIPEDQISFDETNSPTAKMDITKKYYSTFISFSTEDMEFVERLHADLQDRGVRCWFAPKDMDYGAKMRPTIDLAIGQHEKLLLVLSKNSIGSQWVDQEVEKALEKERTNASDVEKDNLVLFPINIDDNVFAANSGWASYIRNSRNIGDFSEWKNYDSYKLSFQRLLCSLEK